MSLPFGTSSFRRPSGPSSASARHNLDSVHGSMSSQHREIAPTATSPPKRPRAVSQQQKRQPVMRKRTRSISTDTDATSTVPGKKQATQRLDAAKGAPVKNVGAEVAPVQKLVSRPKTQRDNADLQDSAGSHAARLTAPDEELIKTLLMRIDGRFGEVGTQISDIWRQLNTKPKTAKEERIKRILREATPSALPLIFPGLVEEINGVKAELARVTVKQRQDFDDELARVTKQQSQDFDFILASCKSNDERIEENVRKHTIKMNGELERHTTQLSQLRRDTNQKLTKDEANNIVFNILKKATPDDLPGISTVSNERMKTVESDVNTLKDEMLLREKEHSTLEKEHSTLKREHSRLRKEHSTLKKEQSTLKKEHSTLKNVVDNEFRSIMQPFQKFNSRIEKLEKTENVSSIGGGQNQPLEKGLEAEPSAREEQAAPPKHTVEGLSKLVEGLQEEMKRRQEEETQSKKAHEELSETVKTLQEKNDALTKLIEKQNMQMDEKESLRERVDTESSRLDAIEVDVHNQHRHVEALQPVPAKLNNTILDVNKFKKTSQASLDKVNVDIDQKCFYCAEGLREDVKQMLERQYTMVAVQQAIIDRLKPLEKSYHYGYPPTPTTGSLTPPYLDLPSRSRAVHPTDQHDHPNYAQHPNPSRFSPRMIPRPAAPAAQEPSPGQSTACVRSEPEPRGQPMQE